MFLQPQTIDGPQGGYIPEKDHKTLLRFSRRNILPQGSGIGILHTPFKRRKECPFQGAWAKATGEIVLDKHLQPALKDLGGVTHLFLLTFMHLANRKKLQTLTPHGPEIHGTFATRSPNRPNPIGLNVVKLLKIKGCRLYVQGVDCLDGTPVIDIKPYNPDIDAFPSVAAGWYEKIKRRGKKKPVERILR
jgi:tRNA-Thr(GGU) m(6)t(6)A37 methyltransferase TsaA